MNSPVCPFCASEQKINNGILAPKCDFCGADLRDESTGCLRLINKDGERFKFKKMKVNIFEEHAKQSVPVLKTYHTFDLYVLLREVREVRQLMYKGYEVLQKASELDTSYKGFAKQEIEKFTEWTKRMYVIENILLERQGYFPNKVTDKVLQYMWEQMKSSKKSKMFILKNNDNKVSVTNIQCSL